MNIHIREWTKLQKPSLLNQVTDDEARIQDIEILNKFYNRALAFMLKTPSFPPILFSIDSVHDEHVIPSIETSPSDFPMVFSLVEVQFQEMGNHKNIMKNSLIDSIYNYLHTLLWNSLEK